MAQPAQTKQVPTRLGSPTRWCRSMPPVPNFVLPAFVLPAFVLPASVLPAFVLPAFVLLALIAAGASAAFAQQWTPTTDAETVRRLTPAVVNIRVVAEAPPDGRQGARNAAAPATPQLRVMNGSGFVVDPSGVILTNEHVIHGASDVTVTFADGASLPARVVEAVRMLDLAVLQVDGDRPRPSVTWGDSAKVQPGDPVFAFGNPLGIGLSVSAGIVSAINRDLLETPYDALIQTDAVINHGNSGGPLFNMEGQVVGVDTAIISPTTGYAGLGFAIPAETARLVVERVAKYGWLRPGWVGIQGTTVTDDMAEALGMTRAEGTMIGEVTAGSPAATAGLRVGDVIRRFGDLTPPDARALQRAILASPIDQTVSVSVRRAGKELTVPVVVAEWPRQDYDQRNGAPARPPRQTVRADLGLTLSAITDLTRARYELPPGDAGVLVVGVMAGTDAWTRGIIAGDVIKRVQDSPVAEVADVQRDIERARALRRKFAVFLVEQKAHRAAGPRWIALRVGNETDGVVADTGK